jgi:hypothetical protein
VFACCADEGGDFVGDGGEGWRGFADEFLDGVGGEEAGGEEAFAALEGADLNVLVFFLGYLISL